MTKKLNWAQRNPEKVKESQKRWRANNADKIKENNKAYYKKNKELLNASSVQRHRENRQWAVDQAGGCCSHCGYNKYLGALDFHHINPKEKDLNYNALFGRTRENIKEEIDKCILLCSNCHREEHHRLRERAKKFI